MTDERVVINIIGDTPESIGDHIVIDMEYSGFYLVTVGVDPINNILQLVFDVMKDDELLRRSLKAVMHMDIKEKRRLPDFISRKLNIVNNIAA